MTQARGSEVVPMECGDVVSMAGGSDKKECIRRSAEMKAAANGSMACCGLHMATKAEG